MLEGGTDGLLAGDAGGEGYEKELLRRHGAWFWPVVMVAGGVGELRWCFGSSGRRRGEVGAGR